jgi:hypothetical protein
MLKAECADAACGYTVRIAARWITEAGPPHCPLHGRMTTPVSGNDASSADAADHDATANGAEGAQ